MCTTCGKRYSRRSNLQRHQDTMHDQHTNTDGSETLTDEDENVSEQSDNYDNESTDVGSSEEDEYDTNDDAGESDELTMWDLLRDKVWTDRIDED